MYEKNGIVYAGTLTEDIRIIAASVLRGGMFLVTCSTGEQRLFDPLVLKGNAFEPWKDESIRNNFTLFHGVLTWRDGEIDIAPETVYAESFKYDMAM